MYVRETSAAQTLACQAGSIWGCWARTSSSTRRASASWRCWTRTRAKAYFARAVKATQRAQLLVLCLRRGERLGRWLGARRQQILDAGGQIVGGQRGADQPEAPGYRSPVNRGLPWQTASPGGSKASRVFSKSPAALFNPGRGPNGPKNYGTLRIISTFQAKAKRKAVTFR